MEITKEHLQRVFDEIEERAIKSGKNGVEYEIVVSTAWLMRTKLLAILKTKSEEDLTLMKMISKDFIDILEKNDGGIYYFRYKCGHGVRPEKVYVLACSVETYTEWKTDVEGLCIECWTMKKRRHGNVLEDHDKKWIMRYE
jgi:hypothetical protein